MKKILINGEAESISILNQSEDEVSFIFREKEFKVKRKNDHELSLDGENRESAFSFSNKKNVIVDGKDLNVKIYKKERNSQNTVLEGSLVSPMPGKILKVLVRESDLVKKGQGLVILEAMKMEHTIKSPKDGSVSKILFNEGDLVDGGVSLVELKDV